MRLSGARYEGVDYIARREGQRLRLLAPVRDFYADAARHLSSVGDARLVASAAATLVLPVPDTAKVLCLALNFRDHAAEAGADLLEHPTVFGRWASTLCTSGATVPVLADEGLDWEAELAAVVGSVAYRVTPEQAAAAILGYTAFNDISARGYQLRTSQWTLGKNTDRSGPVGPEIVTPDELGPISALRLRARVNGETMQDASCADMIFSAEEVLSYVSGAMTLDPGDIIALGTPSGVGWVRTPPRFLRPGDVVEVEVDRIGVLYNDIVAAPGSRTAAIATSARGEP